MAMGFYSQDRFLGSEDWSPLPPPHARDSHATCISGGCAWVGDRETGNLPYASLFVCDASPAGGLRHPDRAGTAGAQRREDHHGLHPRPQPRRSRCPQPGRPPFVGLLMGRVRAIGKDVSGGTYVASRSSGRTNQKTTKHLAGGGYPTDNAVNASNGGQATGRKSSFGNHFHRARPQRIGTLSSGCGTLSSSVETVVRRHLVQAHDQIATCQG